MEHDVIAEDGRVVRAVELGHGDPPPVLCHGGDAPREAFDGLAALPADRVRVIRWDRDDPGGPMTRAISDLDAVRAHFGLSGMALLGHSGGADVALHYALAHPDRVSSPVYVSGAGLDRARGGPAARGRGLAAPTLIVEGGADARPRWGVDSPAEALPDVARVVLPGAGHVPWVESPGSFGWAVLAHLAR
ncbi:alpha/beta fold hydrolase [Actinosynnema sp. NPDC091369]